MRIGIYARKSIFSDKSESTQNQFRLAEEYARANYEHPELVYYEDEGESGSDLNRPGFQRMLNDITTGNLDVVICYKLDRISRDVADFSAMYKVLATHNVELIPLRDNLKINLDMTPIEKAMMYMNSIFSQVERENTVIRITDSMIELAKSGYWAGGKAPIGFCLQRIIVGGKKHTILQEDPEEMGFLNMIADDFLTGYSLSGLETHYRNKDIKTLNDSYLSSTQIWNVLKTPFHAPADSNIYDYYQALGCQMIGNREDFNGTYGVIVYRKSSGSRKRKHVQNPPEKWIVAVGRHQPTMTSEKWLTIQQRFGKNVINKTRKHKIGLIKGALKCSCGYTMRVQHKVDKTYNKIYNNYFCQNRNRRGIEFCSTPFVNVDLLDNQVIETIKKIKMDKSLIDKYVETPTDSNLRSITAIQKDVAIVQKKIKNLTTNLSESSVSTAAKYIISNIEEQDKKLMELNKELREVLLAQKNRMNHVIDRDQKYDMVCHIVDIIDSAEYDEINNLLCNLLECVYDGETLRIRF